MSFAIVIDVPWVCFVARSTQLLLSASTNRIFHSAVSWALLFDFGRLAKRVPPNFEARERLNETETPLHTSDWPSKASSVERWRSGSAYVRAAKTSRTGQGR